jgi:hypothetical protein
MHQANILFSFAIKEKVEEKEIRGTEEELKFP